MLVEKLQKNCYYKVKYTTLEKTTICKKYLEDNTKRDMINWENEVKEYLISKKIQCLPFTTTHSEIHYHTKNCIPIYLCLQSKNLKFFLNEIFSFVNQFKKVGFYHCNTNIYTIYYNKVDCVFSISDFSDSSYNRIVPKNYTQLLFNNRQLVNDIPQKYHDLLSLYLSLFFFFKEDSSNNKILIYLYDLLNDYVPLKIINIFLHNFYFIKNEKQMLGSTKINSIESISSNQNDWL